MKKQMRVNARQTTNNPKVDPETIRLSDLQLEFLDLVGVHVGPLQRIALAAAARARGVK